MIYAQVSNIFDIKKWEEKIISCVLTIYIISHSKHFNAYNQEFMNLLMHLVEIPKPAKPFNTYLKCAKSVFEKFCFKEDKEKKIDLIYIRVEKI